MKCKTERCYREGTVHGYCLVCWNNLPVPGRNKAVRATVEYGKWQLDELDENLLYQLEIQDFEKAYSHPDMTPINGRDFLAGVHWGMYFPPKDRVFYAGQIDTRNDGPLDEAGVSLPASCNTHIEIISGMKDENGNDIAYHDHLMDSVIIDGIERDEDWRDIIQSTIHLRKIKNKPKGYSCPISGDWYILMYGKFVKTLDMFTEYGRKFPDEKGLFYEKNYICIDWKNERIHIALPRNLSFGNRHDLDFIRVLNRRVRYCASLAISAEADSKNLWNVRAFKNDGEMLQGNVRFGVYGEHVKSLFFSRDLPLTETGRKKPILHWVSAHKKRLASGKDIDIDKYLRGSRMLEIGDTTFVITRPWERSDFDFPKWLRENAVYAPKRSVS